MAKQIWVIDPMHSEIMFRVKHMLITYVSGTFDTYQGQVSADKDGFTDMEFEFAAEVNSINTRNGHRDDHLRSNDFFDVANHPTLTFKSKSINQIASHQFEVTGEFTIRGVARTEKLIVNYIGTGLDLYGQRKAGFEITGKLSRADYGLVWNATNEDGSLALGDEVQLTISAQVIKQIATAE